MDESFTGSLASFGDTDEVDEADFSMGNDQQVLQDQVLRSLMLNYGLLEDLEAGATLRDLRRTGPLRDVSEDAQTTLLGSLLYEYSEAASPSRAADARATSLQSGHSLPSAAALADATSTEDFVRLRSGLDRILGEGLDSTAGSAFGSTAGSRLLGDTSMLGSARSPLALGRTASPTSMLALGRTASPTSIGFADTGSRFGEESSPGSIRSRTGGFLDGDLSLMEEEVFNAIRTNDSDGNLGDTGIFTARSDAGLFTARSDARSEGMLGTTDLLASTMGSSHMLDGEDVLEDSTSMMGLGASPSPGASQTLDLDRSGEEVTGMLQRLLALDVAQLDESLARSIRRVLQMGAVLAGARLADEEIRGLPKVRFEQADEQQCSICLEYFKSGELLTELPCRHFFHVECVSTWFQRSTRCPLCRSGCAPERDYSAIAAMVEPESRTPTDALRS